MGHQLGQGEMAHSSAFVSLPPGFAKTTLYSTRIPQQSWFNTGRRGGYISLSALESRPQDAKPKRAGSNSKARLGVVRRPPSDSQATTNSRKSVDSEVHRQSAFAYAHSKRFVRQVSSFNGGYYLRNVRLLASVCKNSTWHYYYKFLCVVRGHSLLEIQKNTRPLLFWTSRSLPRGKSNY